MKAAKTDEHERHVERIRERRKAKEEKERVEKLAGKMHQKVLERRNRRAAKGIGGKGKGKGGGKGGGKVKA